MREECRWDDLEVDLGQLACVTLKHLTDGQALFEALMLPKKHIVLKHTAVVVFPPAKQQRLTQAAEVAVRFGRFS